MSSSNKISVGIVGSAGYAGGELIRLLLNHANTEIVFAHSNSNSGKFIYEVHTDLFGETAMKFSSALQNVDVLFLCLGHGEAKKFLAENKIDAQTKVIDLSQDHRMYEGRITKDEVKQQAWVYGLPELNREEIKTATHLANPGCFATAIQLALLPLAKNNLLKSEVHVNATTGSTGAGQSLNDTSHFSWRQNNLGAYKVFNHQHLEEIGQSMKHLQNDFKENISFVPQRGSFTRGIFASMYTDCELTIEQAQRLFTEYYAGHPFVHISQSSVDMKQVVNTNKCLLHLEKHENKLMVVSIIDNLLKGAAGQAVQNMNIMYGLEETTGLKLKASAF